jgi:hypothetical protein
VYRLWSSKEELLARAIETVIQNEGLWPANEEIACTSQYEIIGPSRPTGVIMGTLQNPHHLLTILLGPAPS